jgi:putative MATE family efflux protein
MNAPARKLTLFALAWPIFGENLLHTLVQTVDTLMVSHVSDDAAAAVGQAGQVVWVSIILFTFIAIGSGIVITHHLGAKDRPGAARIATAAIAANTWIGLVVSVLVYLFARPALRLLQMPEQLQGVAMQFLPLMGGTLFLEAQNIAMGAVLRAHGHTRDPLWVVFVQNLLNAAGNCLLLFGLLGFPRLGVMGVAISGVVSRLIAFGAFWILVRRRTGVRMELRDYFRFPAREIGRILRIGLPSAGENLLWTLAFMTMTSFIALMGPKPLAVQAYVMQVSSWIIQFGWSVGLANEILVGHHVGAGRFDEAYREALRSLRTAFLMEGIGVVPVAIFAPYLLGLFTHDPEIIRIGSVLLRLGLLLETGRVFNIILVMSLRATGDSVFPFAMAVASMWGIWVPLAWLLGLKLGLGLPGPWIAMMADEWFRATTFFRRWRRRGWLDHAHRSRAHAEAAISDLAAV